MDLLIQHVEEDEKLREQRIQEHGSAEGFEYKFDKDPEILLNIFEKAAIAQDLTLVKFLHTQLKVEAEAVRSRPQILTWVCSGTRPDLVKYLHEQMGLTASDFRGVEPDLNRPLLTALNEGTPQMVGYLLKNVGLTMDDVLTDGGKAVVTAVGADSLGTLKILQAAGLTAQHLEPIKTEILVEIYQSGSQEALVLLYNAQLVTAAELRDSPLVWVFARAQTKILEFLVQTVEIPVSTFTKLTGFWQRALHQDSSSDPITDKYLIFLRYVEETLKIGYADFPEFYRHMFLWASQNGCQYVVRHLRNRMKMPPVEAPEHGFTPDTVARAVCEGGCLVTLKTVLKCGYPIEKFKEAELMARMKELGHTELLEFLNASDLLERLANLGYNELPAAAAAEPAAAAAAAAAAAVAEPAAAAAAEPAAQP